MNSITDQIMYFILLTILTLFKDSIHVILLKFTMALLFVAKLLIAVGLLFQAYLLYDDKASATAFDARLSTVLGVAGFIPA